MIRRNARLRREYLYRKSLEGKEREEYERKRKIRQALEGSLTLRLSGLVLPAINPAQILWRSARFLGTERQSNYSAAPHL